MKFKGDIKVWVDEKRACARLIADGPEGPIVVQASAPLEMVQRRVKRALAARGHDISGDHPGFDALVNGVARSTALHRLEHLAPALFVPGGVATYLAVRELKRRRRARELARQRELAMKRLGQADEPDDDDDRDDFDDDEDQDQDGEYVGWRRPRNRRPGPHVGAPFGLFSRAASATSAPQGRAATSLATSAAAATPQGRAGLTLFRLARRNRKVGRVVARAQNGDPHAQAQVRVMTKRIAAAQASQAAAGLPGRPSTVALLAQPTPAAKRRGIFWPWDPDVLRRRGA
jgi:hypothetical protein